MIRIETYKEGLVDEFVYNREDFTAEEARRLIRQWAQTGLVFFALQEEKPICAAGFIETGWNNAVAWGFFNKEVERCKFMIIRSIKAAFQASKYKCITAMTKLGGKEERFANLFMRLVGVIDNYGPTGEPYGLFVYNKEKECKLQQR